MKTTPLLFVAALLTSIAATAQTPVPQPAQRSYALTADVAYATKYVFRGVELAEESLQPSLKFEYGKIYAGIWSNIPLDGGYELEIDGFAGYTFDLGNDWSVDAGLTLYNYPGLDTPGSDKTTVEPFVGLNGTVLGLKSGTYVFRDLTLKTTTFQQNLGYEIPLDDRFSLALSGSMGVTDPDTGPKYFYWQAGLMIPYKLNEKTTFTFGAQYAANDIDTTGDAFWGVASLGYSF